MSDNILVLSQPLANEDSSLRREYVNQRLQDMQAPAVILDIAVVRRNSQRMLKTARDLGVQWRSHIKTHKTIEGTKLQAGEEGPVRLVVSTIAELNHILPWLKECIVQGREPTNVLYGLPVSPSNLRRLAQIGHTLGSSKHISLLVDHPDTLVNIAQSHELWPESKPASIFIKIDTGYHRAGVLPSSKTLAEICSKLEAEGIKGNVQVSGLYSHLGHSYAFQTPEESVDGLLGEFETLLEVAQNPVFGAGICLTVGATPTATSAEALLSASPDSDVARRWKALKASGNALELHAGVYPVLDLQQLGTHARVSNLDYKDVGIRVLAEVASLYPERSPPEALVAAGSLALGREPCRWFPGWGIVSPWDSSSVSKFKHFDEQGQTGWIVGRISQEHGVLTWQGDVAAKRELTIGEKVMIWPTHACVAGAGFDFYLVVDGDSGDENVIRDVWGRCRGW